MTEGEWHNKSQLVAMLSYTRRAGFSDRKIGLAAAAFCRSLWSKPFPEAWKCAVERFEEWIDRIVPIGTVDDAEQLLLRLTGTSMDALKDSPNLTWYEGFYGGRAAIFLTRLRHHSSGLRGFQLDAKDVAWNVSEAHGPGMRGTVRAAECGVVRDIFGNPFRPVTFDPSWRTSTAVAIAQQMYDSREFSVMPILADALQDAGCTSDEILNHCRDANGVHVRGCWVVDLVLGKS